MGHASSYNFSEGATCVQISSTAATIMAQFKRKEKFVRDRKVKYDTKHQGISPKLSYLPWSLASRCFKVETVRGELSCPI